MKKSLILIIIFLFLINATSFADEQNKNGLLSKEIQNEIDSKFFESAIKLYSQTLVFFQPIDWPINPIYRSQKGSHFIAEFVPENQTVKNWTDMLTVQAFEGLIKKQNFTSGAMVNLLAKDISKHAPKEFYFKVLFNKKVKGYNTIIVLMGLKQIPPENKKGELGLFLVVEGNSDIYLIHRSWRRSPYNDQALPISKNELKEWAKVFTMIKII